MSLERKNAYNFKIIDENTLYRIQQAARHTKLNFEFNQCEEVHANGSIIKCRCCIKHKFYYGCSCGYIETQQLNMLTDNNLLFLVNRFSFMPF